MIHANFREAHIAVFYTKNLNFVVKFDSTKVKMMLLKYFKYCMETLEPFTE